MLVLFETAAGYALFKVVNEKKLKQVNDIHKEFSSVESTGKIVQLQKFKKFKNTADALKATTSLVDGKLSKSLKSFLSKEISEKQIKDELAISDSKLGQIIKEKLDIQCIHNNAVEELIRGIRSQINGLLGDVTDADMKAMSLGLSHSLSRYKLKFSPDKVDTMIIQAIALLDDLNKELNTYSMRVREWYGWHFPELSKVIPENVLFAKAVKKMGVRTNAATTDFTDFLTEDMDRDIKEAAQISMGTEVSEEDIDNITSLCDQVISISEYAEQLYEYLKNRMQAIAPNLTVMVGELVGARLISHAGSLLSLAKHPASTVQILGAEKALFRALKTKHDTPKYGLIYHASLIGQAPPKLKGKISRVLAAKTSLSARCDAFGEGEMNTDLATTSLAKVEMRLKSLEVGANHRISGTGKGRANAQKYDYKSNSNGQSRGPADSYNANKDSTLGKKAATSTTTTPSKKQKVVEEEQAEEQPEEQAEETPKKKDKKEKKEKRSKKEKKSEEPAAEDTMEETPKESRKKRKQPEEATEEAAEAPEENGDKKKRKRKSKSLKSE